MYAKAAQQKQEVFQEHTEMTGLGLAPPMRARAQSEDAARRESHLYRYPLLPASPEKAVLRPNMNRGNMMRVVKKTSYESLRKESKVTKGVEYGRLAGHGRKDSRTLVKMRQPWNEEPRGERRRANS